MACIPTVEKAVAETFPIGLTYVDPDIETGETISAATVAVTPSGLTLSAVTISGATVSAFASAGAAGTEYTVLFKVTLSSGKIFNNSNKDAILVRVV
jgi:hypothetical protein